MNSSNTQKYLTHFSEPESGDIAQGFMQQFSHTQYQYVLTIPAYREDNTFFLRLKNTLLKTHSVLLIIVINQPDKSEFANTDMQKNRQLLESIHKHSKLSKTQANVSFLTLDDSSIIVVDRFSEGLQIPYKQGVGLARKIACDIACHLIANNMIASQWIHTTDADTLLPDNYFLALQKQACKKYSAAIYPFTHKGEDTAINEATALYEKALNYYVMGLQWAGSRYAFHTIGSCIAINTEYYTQARGYPKRAAGEDFYLLNKLAKLGDILLLKNCELAITARVSNRVPFGTGPAVAKILHEQAFDYYHPYVFAALKKITAQSVQLFDNKSSPEHWLTLLSEQQREALKAIGIDSFFKHLSTHIKTQAQCQRHWQNWLDAFKTLKLIHALEDYYPKLPINQAIAVFAELKATNDEP